MKDVKEIERLKFEVHNKEIEIKALKEQLRESDVSSKTLSDFRNLVKGSLHSDSSRSKAWILNRIREIEKKHIKEEEFKLLLQEYSQDQSLSVENAQDIILDKKLSIEKIAKDLKPLMKREDFHRVLRNKINQEIEKANRGLLKNASAVGILGFILLALKVMGAGLSFLSIAKVLGIGAIGLVGIGSILNGLNNNKKIEKYLKYTSQTKNKLNVEYYGMSMFPKYINQESTPKQISHQEN